MKFRTVWDYGVRHIFQMYMYVYMYVCDVDDDYGGTFLFFMFCGFTSL